MCVYSAIMDDWNKKNSGIDPIFPNLAGTVTRIEFVALKAEVEALKKLLIAAKIYDEDTGQPDCETDSKLRLLRSLAEELNIDLKDI